MADEITPAENVALGDVYPPEQPTGTKPPTGEPNPQNPEKPEKPEKENQIPKDKPLKVKASELEMVVLVPKGYEGQYPVAQAANEEMLKQQNEISDLKSQVTEMSKKLEEKDKIYAELQKQVTTRDEQDRATVASEIVESRLSLGLLEIDQDEAKAKEQKEGAVKELSKLPIDQLKTLSEDAKKLAKATKPEGGKPVVFTPGTTTHSELSNEQTKIEEKRLSLFGHKKPLGEEGEK